jgi:hypothetical protein
LRAWWLPFCESAMMVRWIGTALFFLFPFCKVPIYSVLIWNDIFSSSSSHLILWFQSQCEFHMVKTFVLQLVLLCISVLQPIVLLQFSNWPFKIVCCLTY